MLKDDVWQAPKQVAYPGYTRDIVSFKLVERVAACDGQVTLALTIADLPEETRRQILAGVQAAVVALPEVTELKIEVKHPAAPPAAATPPIGQTLRPASIRTVVAVGAGKGGVGKSTVAANVAVALAQRGLWVGLLDADVYGPNAPRILGAAGLPEHSGDKIAPARAAGVRMMSTAFMVRPDDAVIWRGPMTDKLIRQFLTDVDWGELDILVVDLPPGTGDIPLTVAQRADPDGAIIVVTPQDLAVDDARKAITMFRHLEIPILGIVENMSYFVCGACDTRHDLFGQGGGRRLAKEMEVPFLGAIPFETSVQTGSDRGEPAVQRSDSPAGAALGDLAGQVWKRLSESEAGASRPVLSPTGGSHA